MDAVDQLADIALVPVVEITDADQAVPLGDALLEAGLPCAEITFRTDAAVDAIRAMRAGCRGLLVGAGTILTVRQADAAVDAGAAFLVSPGFNDSVVTHALRLGIPMLPGVCTPTEIEMALGHGLSVVKFFPAEAAGGVGYLKAVAAPYRGVRYVPTGGIGPSNLAQYLALPEVLACGGSWMVARNLIAAGDFATVRRLAAEAVSLVRSARPVATSVASGRA